MEPGTVQGPPIEDKVQGSNKADRYLQELNKSEPVTGTEASVKNAVEVVCTFQDIPALLVAAVALTHPFGVQMLRRAPKLSHGATLLQVAGGS